MAVHNNCKYRVWCQRRTPTLTCCHLQHFVRYSKSLSPYYYYVLCTGIQHSIPLTSTHPLHSWMLEAVFPLDWSHWVSLQQQDLCIKYSNQVKIVGRGAWECLHDRTLHTKHAKSTSTSTTYHLNARQLHMVLLLLQGSHRCTWAGTSLGLGLVETWMCRNQGYVTY